MPELPEVETIRRILEPQLTGQKIVSIAVNNPQIIAYPEMEHFTNILVGQIITSMSRRGKYLTIHFEKNDSMTVHLRMTGQLLVTPNDYPEERHTHLVAGLSDGMEIRYIDVRRFGRFWHLKADEADTVTGISNLGIEPFDELLTADYLKDKLGKRKKPIKEMLLDQSIVTGIGNIYSDEILFSACIYPETKCSDMTAEQWKRLAKAIPEILTWGIEANKMTAEEYLSGMGKEYHNTPFLKAYGHEGKPCPNCGSLFEKLTIGGRSSCFCPRCQK